MRVNIKRFFPILTWGKEYTAETLTNDLVAAVIVTIMLIPQSLAYALLAGLPPEIGLYASVAPLILYAIFGTSRALAVGPVAVVSLMTGAAIANLGLTDPGEMIAAAITMAFISGAMLLALGFFRLGFLANFLSHPVIAGFITASGILIAFSQVKHVLGIQAGGHNLTEQIIDLVHNLGDTNVWTLVIGLSALGFLFWGRVGLKPLLVKAGLSPKMAGIGAKAGPVAAVVLTTLAVWVFGLDQRGVAIVGDIPRGFPSLSLPSFDSSKWAALLVPALMLSIIGFVESVSVAQTFAARRRQRIDPNQELIALGASNIGASVAGGLPVTGGFSRSVVNFDAGAETPAAGAYTAVGIGLAVLFLTPFLFFLPKATLAATIIVAVLGLVDLSILKKTWDYSFADFAAVAATIFVTLAFGVEAGVSAGVGISIALHLFKTARPHVAEVGLVPGTEHFRNINRHDVLTDPSLVTIRVDESLYFANARYLEDLVYDRVVCDQPIEHVVLMCSAVNALDMSALESLEAINHRLGEMGIKLHLSEVKGPVMDRLQTTHFLEELTGTVFLSQFAAQQALAPPKPKPTEATAAE